MGTEKSHTEGKDTMETDQERLRILEKDDAIADHTMNEAISNYDRSIARLNMMLVVCGVMSTICMTALTSQWEHHLYSLILFFTVLVTTSTAVCIMGLFSKRSLEGMLNPNFDDLRRAESMESFLNTSIDTKMEVAKAHFDANDQVWRFIHVSYVVLSLALFVLLIIVVELMIS